MGIWHQLDRCRWFLGGHVFGCCLVVAVVVVDISSQAVEALTRRMADDEVDLLTYFESYVKLDRLHRHLGLLSDMRELLTADR